MKQKEIINTLKELITNQDNLLFETITLLNKHIELIQTQQDRLNKELKEKETLSNQLSIVLYNVHQLTRFRVKDYINIQVLTKNRLTVSETANLLNINESSLRTFLARDKKCPQPIKEVGLKSYYLSKDIILLIDYLIENSTLIKSYESILPKDNKP